MPIHNHIIGPGAGGYTGGSTASIVQLSIANGTQYSNNAGGDLPHNNMQPYIVVPVCIQLKLVTGVDQAIFEANASTLGGLTKNAFALMNGTPANLFEALDGVIGKQVVNISQYANSKSANGYQKFPGGLILQWGSLTTTAGAGTITLPITFPTAALKGFVSASGASTLANLSSLTTTSISVSTYNSTNASALSAGVSYYAIGY